MPDLEPHAPPPTPDAASPAAPEPYVPARPPPPLDGSEVWPPAARAFTGVMVVVGLALLGWRGYGMSRWSTRPAPIEHEAWASPIDLNGAGPADLRTIPGVGDTLAERIVRYREANGPFRSLDELRQVRGIGPLMLERLLPYLRLGSSPGGPVVRGSRPEEPESKTAGGGRKVTPAGKVEVNRATADELRTLPGIGPSMAARIIEARRERPFGSIDELRRVKGIGAKTLEKLRPFIEARPP